MAQWSEALGQTLTGKIQGNTGNSRTEHQRRQQQLSLLRLDQAAIALFETL
jgi:hypothetical protein